MTDSNKKLIYASIGVILFKIYAAYMIPLTGDEAYFISWGKTFAAGYYDHPPMVGWTVYLLSFISGSYFFLRLFSIAVSAFAGWLIYLCAKEEYPDQAKNAAFLYMISPVHIMILLFSNDVLLFIFTLIAALLFYLALKKDSLLITMTAGLVFGLAFMSKYLSFPMLVGLFFYAIFSDRRRKFLHFSIFCLMIIPFFAQNMYYNYTHCWNNIMFNIMNRTSGTKNLFTSLLALAVDMVCVFLPWLLFFMWKSRKEINKRSMSFMMLAVPIVLLSARRKIDMHWLLPIVPFFFITTAAFGGAMMKKAIKITAIVTLTLAVFTGTILALPMSLLKHRSFFSTLIVFSDTNKICEKLTDYDDMTLVTKSYVLSSALDAQCGRDAHVMFSTSKHGRQDDSRIDLRTLEGKDIAIFSRRPVSKKDFRKYFERVDTRTFNVDGVDFYVMEGYGFRYEAYRNKYLKSIYKQFYSFPSWLKPKSCQFCDDYFPEG